MTGLRSDSERFAALPEQRLAANEGPFAAPVHAPVGGAASTRVAPRLLKVGEIAEPLIPPPRVTRRERRLR